MAAIIVLILAILSRFLPHALHTAAWGVTALGGGLLFAGSRWDRPHRWQVGLAVLGIAVSDWVLTTRVYGFPFHVSGYVVTWLWYGLLCLAASAWLYRRSSFLRVVMAALFSSTGFFLLSNGMVWATGTMYARSIAGLTACYVAGLPFYRNDVLSTLAVCGILFGVPALARRFAVEYPHNTLST
ncbi:DUF6580 family putative transport protein [Terriglobus aquaticus]|uniref:DUF6580 family putative transport protein n=1 Tax=Terriglobus aquaticus TaxID=940139 RepID=A0ABW9KQ28_9BACT|nr:DUF6580 family putative transport protein [Terriglobus aquaticus]